MDWVARCKEQRGGRSNEEEGVTRRKEWRGGIGNEGKGVTRCDEEERAAKRNGRWEGASNSSFDNISVRGGLLCLLNPHVHKSLIGRRSARLLAHLKINGNSQVKARKSQAEHVINDAIMLSWNCSIMKTYDRACSSAFFFYFFLHLLFLNLLSNQGYILSDNAYQSEVQDVYSPVYACACVCALVLFMYARAYKSHLFLCFATDQDHHCLRRIG